MDFTNLPLFERCMTDPSTTPSAPDTTLSDPDTSVALDTLDAPTLRTFADAIAYVEASQAWTPAAKRELKTALRWVAFAVSVVTARKTGQHLDPNPKKLDLARIPFDVAAINGPLEGVSFGLAGFASDKSYRNAKSGLRRICRELGIVEPLRAPELPPDSPYAPLLAVADKFQLATVRRFAAKMMQQGRHPGDVTDDDLRHYGTFLATRMVAVKIKPMLRRIVQLWRRAAASHPDWPQIPAKLDCEAKPFNPRFSAYPVSLQSEIAAISHWLEGSIGAGPFDENARKPLRPATIKLHFAYIRLILAQHVSLGNDIRSMSSLRDLLSREVMQPILQSIWQLGQTRQQALPEARRDRDPGGRTGQLGATGRTVLMLTQYFQLEPDVAKQIQGLVKRTRKPRMTAMSRRNQARIDQFLDPVKRGLLLNLPATLMAEAQQLRERQPAEAARLARTAIIFAMELRIALRMKNLHTCRLGHNLRFAGGDSPIAILSFQGYEMKNGQDIEFSIGRRLCQTLQTYIEHFLPWFAATSPDFAENQWLFPAGRGKAGSLSYSQVRKTIVDTVAERVGAEFHPHLFRSLAVEFCLKYDPGGLEHCRQLLGHKSMQTLLIHYTPVRTRQAAERQDKLVNEEADRLAILAAPIKRRRKSGGRS